ncbi:MAG: 50S ribosomal protein L25/general stress protein Ctc [Gemmatimonadaceae bacterium]|nr:50S ribosomal protein L25/general stress protein Ctc [Gemmatimonadaceae bacterium]
MATANLSAAARTGTGKGVSRSLRREGRIPAVIYGRARAPLALSLDARELSRLLGHINAETTVIDLAIDGAAARTLIRDIQRHPLSRAVIHVDFQELVAGEKVVVKIPIVLVGTSVGVRLSGGIMTQVLQELECRVDPANIPSRIEVDVTEVTIGHSIHVSEVKVPDGVEVLDEGTGTIMIVSAPKEEAAAAPVEGASPTEPELIRKAKAEDETPEKK